MESPQVNPVGIAPEKNLEIEIKMEPAANAAAEALFCCVGVDHPGFGFVHAEDCPVAPGRATSAPFRHQPIPASLLRLIDDEQPADLICAPRDRAEALADHSRAERIEGLLAPLLFRARNAAEGSLVPVTEGSNTLHCAECRMTEHLGHVRHTPTCKQGAVLETVDQILREFDFDLNIKEVAPEAEGARDCTDDGIRLCGLKDRVCMLCGERDGEWDAEWRGPGKIDLADLKLNQCVSVGVELRGHTLFTHRCEKQGSGVRDQGLEKPVERAVASAIVGEMLESGGAQ